MFRYTTFLILMSMGMSAPGWADSAKPAVRPAAETTASAQTYPLALGVGQSFGSGSASSIALEYWPVSSLGIGLEAGFTYTHRYEQLTPSDPLVDRVHVTAVPRGYLAWEAVERSGARLLLVGGAGARIAKPAGNPTTLGLAAHAGPTIEIPLPGKTALRAGARVEAASDKAREAGLSLKTQTQLSFLWWIP